MIEPTPGNLSREYGAMKRFRELHTEPPARIERDIAGVHYREDQKERRTPDNRGFGHQAQMLPDLAYSRPHVTFTSTRPKTDKDMLDGLEQFINTWSEITNFGADHIRCVRQMLTGFGVMMVALEPWSAGLAEKYDGGRLMPIASWLPRNRFLLDTRCEDWTQFEIIGHEYVRSRDWLEDNRKKYGFNRDALNAIPLNVDDDTAAGDGKLSERAFMQGKGPPRNMVRLADLYLRDRNMIVTLVVEGHAAADSGRVLREADYVGPPDGPYEVFGAYQASDDPYPISMLQACYTALEDLNAQTKAVLEADTTYARFVIVDAKQKELTTAITDAGNGQVYGVDGFNGTQGFASVEKGGANAEQVASLKDRGDRFDRTIGEGDEQRGRASNKTATGSQISQQNIDAKKGWIKEQVYKSTTRVIQKVAWFAIENPLVVQSVAITHPTSGQVMEAIFLGGRGPGEEDVDYSTVMAKITDDSMSLQDDQVVQAHAQQLTELSQTWLQLKMTAPAVNTDYLVKMYGESINIKDLPDLLFNEEMLQQQMAMQQQQQAQQQAMAAQGGPAQPQMFNQGLGQGGGGGPTSQGKGLPALPQKGIPNKAPAGKATGRAGVATGTSTK